MVGQTIGKYRIVERVGTSASRGTYRAVDDALGRDVVIKVLDADPTDPAVVDRFRAEAIPAARLNHPGIAAVYELFQHEGEWLVVMEFVRGETIEALVRRKGPLGVEEAVNYCVRALDALAHAHGHGVVHRGLNLTNVVVLEAGDVKILDFGVARLVGAAQVADPALMVDPLVSLAPEQIAGQPVDARADLYAIGIMLFHLLTGKLPFEGSTPAEVVTAKMSDQLTSIDSLRTDLPEWVSEVMTIAIDSRPDRRFQSAELFRDFLERRVSGYSADRGVAMATPITPSTPLPVPSARVPITAPAGSPATIEPHVLDENVQFTVFRPRVLPPTEWRTMLVFAHLAERRSDASEDDPDPTAEVSRQAASVLGDVSDYRQLTEDSRQPVPREGDLLFVPFAEGLQFNPSSRAFSWTETVHKEEFRMRASASMAGRTVSGRVTVYLGAIVIAEIGMTLKVGTSAAEVSKPAATSARPYRNIFASYSHRDRAVVEEFSEYARAVGDRYLRDVIDLRSGERWAPGLEGLIRQADVFQLFWSWNALASQYVRQEWQYALSLGRPSFVRPVYWDDPLPEGQGLPPEALRELHFERIQPRSVAVTASPNRATPDPYPTPPATMRMEHTGPMPTVGSSSLETTPEGTLPTASAPRSTSRYLVYAGAAAAVVVALGVTLINVGLETDDGSRPAAVDRSASSAATAAPPTEDRTLTFTGVTFYAGTSRSLSAEDAVMRFAHDQISVLGRSDGKERAAMSYGEVLSATYTRARVPGWDSSLSSPARTFNVTRGQDEASHWLVVQARDSYMILSLEDATWAQVLQTLEERTGITVDRRTTSR